MSREARRALTALIVFAAVFWLGPVLTRQNVYDIRIETARLGIAVLGAGLYWIGSREP